MVWCFGEAICEGSANERIFIIWGSSYEAFGDMVDAIICDILSLLMERS